MFSQITKKIFNPIPIVSLSLFLFSASASSAIYMQIEGLDGDSNDAAHPDWIDVLSVSEGIVRPDAEVGGTRTRAAAVFEDIGVGKFLDKTSPKLREALAQGKIYPMVTIEITATCNSDAPAKTYFSYELTNASLTRVSLSASSSGDRPVEQVAINFTKVKWKYFDLDQNCALKGTVEANWDISLGTP